MPEWEYISINLSDLPLKTEPLDLLNDAGRDGWELVGINSSGVAYLKRQIGKPNPKSARPVRGSR